MITDKVDKLKEMQIQHHKSTTPMDEYFTGFYNGIEYSLCVIESRDPIYKECEKPTHRQMHLQTLIQGHMEAMRPLLSEWSTLNSPAPLGEKEER
jgi:hypothetical protein